MAYQLAFRKLANIPAYRHSVIFAFIYMGIIYLLSSVPGSHPHQGDPTWFRWTAKTAINLVHVPLFAILAWLWRWSLEAWSNIRPYAVPITFCLTISYGIFDEWHQGFTPRRDSSILDIILDACGAWIALWLYSKYNIKKR